MRVNFITFVLLVFVVKFGFLFLVTGDYMQSRTHNQTYVTLYTHGDSLHRLLMHHDYEVEHTFALISTSSWLISILLAFPSNGFLTEMLQRDFALP